MNKYVDFNKTTSGHTGSERDMFSLTDLQNFLDSLSLIPFSDAIIFKCSGRACGTLKIRNINGVSGNLLKFESTDPVNNPAILVYKI